MRQLEKDAYLAVWVRERGAWKFVAYQLTGELGRSRALPFSTISASGCSDAATRAAAAWCLGKSEWPTTANGEARNRTIAAVGGAIADRLSAGTIVYDLRQFPHNDKPRFCAFGSPKARTAACRNGAIC
jgi:hypothetical protein